MVVRKCYFSGGGGPEDAAGPKALRAFPPAPLGGAGLLIEAEYSRSRRVV